MASQYLPLLQIASSLVAGLLIFWVVYKLAKSGRLDFLHFKSWRIPQVAPGFLVRKTSNIKKLSELLVRAGLSHAIQVDYLLSLKQYLLWVVVLIIVTFIFLERNWIEILIWGAVALVVSLRAPELYLKRRVSHRNWRAQREFASVIDFLRLYVAAGQNIEGAWRSLAAKLEGVFGEEFKKVVRSLDCGVPFNDALYEMSSRVSLEDLNRFLLAIKQTQQLGTSMNDTLDMQAELVRTRLRQRAEELARTAGVKISIPLVFFIFPALLIVYLGPAIVQFLREF
jgi:tight adherence protein C